MGLLSGLISGNNPGAILPGTSQAGTGQAGPVMPGRAEPGRAGPGVALAPAAPAAGSGPSTADEPVPLFLVDAGRAAVAWAHRRALGLSSATGISMAMAVCAASWFSAGTRTDIVRGVAALWASYLVLAAGLKLAAPASQVQAVLRPDIGPGPAVEVVKGIERRHVGAAWLAALGGSLAESVAYAGLAVGAAAEHWAGVWTLAVAVLGLVAVRNLMTACSTPPGFGQKPDSLLRQVAAAVLTMPIGGRVLLIGIVAPFWGARAALFALLDWAIISVGYGIAGHAVPGLADEDRVRVPGAGDVGAPSRVLRLRDDGVLARSLGVLVRGNLMPLPPALLGLVAVAALALLGLHGLPGVLMIAPAIVMLLAAPGSGHPHTGRFDWLVPVLLLGSQFLYLAATGLAAGVPGPVIFTLVAALLLRYCDLAFPGRPVLLAKSRRTGADRVERGTGLGWEGRMLLAGLAAAMGIATFAYLALAAYLGLLIGVKIVTSCLAPQEDLRRDRPGYGGRREPPFAS